MTRENILSSYCVKVNCPEDVDRLNTLERESDEINYVGKGDWVWTSEGPYYVGTKDSEYCDFGKESWGHVFHSVDEFEQFLKSVKPKYREYKGVRYPTDMDAFLKLGPYCDSDSLYDYINLPEGAGGIPDELFNKLGDKFGYFSVRDLTDKLQQYWKVSSSREQRQQYKNEYDESIKKMYESAKPLLPHQVYASPSIDVTPESNPLSKLVCKKQKKSLDLSPKKIREVKIKT